MKKWILALIILLASIILLFVLNRNEKNKFIYTEVNKVISDVVDTSVDENTNLDSNINENTNEYSNIIDDEKDTDIKENVARDIYVLFKKLKFFQGLYCSSSSNNNILLNTINSLANIIQNDSTSFCENVFKISN
jgi:hypothetical protein